MTPDQLSMRLRDMAMLFASEARTPDTDSRMREFWHDAAITVLKLSMKDEPTLADVQPVLHELAATFDFMLKEYRKQTGVEMPVKKYAMWLYKKNLKALAESKAKMRAY